jgi:hypothetical protein
MEREKKRRHSAAVRRDRDLIRRQSREVGEGGPHQLLQRMSGIDVPRAGRIHHLRRQQHAGVFARTVVVQRRRRLARRAKVCRRLVVVRQVRAAEQVLFIELALAQHRRRGGHMQRLAAMRRARQRDLLGREVVFIDAAVFEQRNGLKRLGCRAQTTAHGRIAGECDELSASIDDGDRSAVY